MRATLDGSSSHSKCNEGVTGHFANDMRAKYRDGRMNEWVAFHLLISAEKYNELRKLLPPVGFAK